jgi:hypothetical protein
MYKVATFLTSHFWGKPSDMADALGVLLLTWNQAFYRYGFFDFDSLEKCILNNFNEIQVYRNMDIEELSDHNEKAVKSLFVEFNQALQIASGKKKGIKSPVSAAKCLHLLAPGVFPLWDDKIARAYGCYYGKEPSDKYFSFCRIIRRVAHDIKNYVDTGTDSIVKLIDEYNYSKYTKGWV